MNKNKQSGIIHIGILGILFIVIMGAILFKTTSTKFGLTSIETEAARSNSPFGVLSASLDQYSATFNFTNPKPGVDYSIDLSIDNKLTGVDKKLSSADVSYVSFGQGQTGPIVVNAPTFKWNTYKCGQTLYWRVRASNTTGGAGSSENWTALQKTAVNCLSAPTSTPTATATPVPSESPTPAIEPTSTPTPTPTSSVTKPAVVTMEGSDGTWCYDSDKDSGYWRTVGTCQDSSMGLKNDYCEESGTARDGYCTGIWNGSSWRDVKCAWGGYVCPSWGLSCINGACQ